MTPTYYNDLMIAALCPTGTPELKQLLNRLSNEGLQELAQGLREIHSQIEVIIFDRISDLETVNDLELKARRLDVS